MARLYLQEEEEEVLDEMYKDFQLSKIKEWTVFKREIWYKMSRKKLQKEQILQKIVILLEKVQKQLPEDILDRKITHGGVSL